MAYKNLNEKSVIKIDREVYNLLKKSAKKLNISVTELVVANLKNFLANKTKQEIEKRFVDERAKEIRIFLTKEEILFLNSEKKAHGFLSLRRECEFRLLNSINEKKEYYTSEDMEALLQIKAELNSIGRNLNIVAKRLQAPSAKIEMKNLEKFLEYIQNNIQKINQSLGKNILKTSERYEL